jgi:hypothetical protein
VDFDKKIAMQYFKKGFYDQEQERIQNLYKNYLIKQKRQTPKSPIVSNIIEEYTEFGKEQAKLISQNNAKEIINNFNNFGLAQETKVFKILTNIRDTNIKLEKSPKKHNDLIGLISNPFILASAYRTIRSKKGAMTESYPLPNFLFSQLDKDQQDFVTQTDSLPDNMSWDTIMSLSDLIKRGKYPFGVTRQIWIPKPGRKDSLRPINITLFCDKIVQEAIRMVLECIYEPEFHKMNCSFGFRSANGCREAIVSIADNSQGFTTAIEGDIQSAYPNMNCEFLINILREKIGDQKFLNLIRERLNRIVYDAKTSKYEKTFLGLPQGGVDSPYLWNIYLIGMDKFIKERLTQLVEIENNKRLNNHKTYPINKHHLKLKSVIDARIKKLKIHKQRYQDSKKLQKIENFIVIPPYSANPKNKTKSRDFYDPQKTMFFESYKVRDRHVRDKNILNEEKQIVFNLIKEINKLKKQRLKFPYIDPQQNKVRFHYVRYADDFIILGNFSLAFANNFKKELALWLTENREASLSESKTLITNLLLKPAKFLGFQLHANKARKIRILKNPKTNKMHRQRVAGSMLTIGPDKERMINRLFLKGFCDRKGFPKSMGWLVGFEPHIIVDRYNSIMRGFAEYYTDFITYKSLINRWLYILRWSCLKTLAQKYNTSIKKIFQKFYDPYSNINNVKVKYIIVVKDKQGKPLPLQKTWTLLTQKQATDLSSKGAYMDISWKLKNISRGIIQYSETVCPQRTPRIMDSDFLERISWVNLRTRASFDMPCSQCGSMENIQMHHINQIKKSKFSLIPESDSLKRIMVLRNRKQCPLCEKCHIKYHNTHMPLLINNIPIIGVHETPLHDIRSIDSEKFIHKGQIHQGLPLPENFYERGWKDVNPTKPIYN